MSDHNNQRHCLLLFFWSASNNPIVQLGVPRVGPFVFVWKCIHPLQMMSEFQCEVMTVLWDCNEQRTVVALLSERILLICINGSFPFPISWIPKSVYCCSSLWHPQFWAQMPLSKLCVFLFFLKKETKNLPPSLTGSQGSYLTAAWQPLKNCQIHLCLQSNAAPRQQNPLLITNQIWFLCQEGATQFFYSLAACWQINPCLTFICTNKYSG